MYDACNRDTNVHGPNDRRRTQVLIQGEWNGFWAMLTNFLGRKKFRFKRRTEDKCFATLALKVVPSFSTASFVMKLGHRRRAHEFITWPAFQTQRNISDRTDFLLVALEFNLLLARRSCIDFR